MSSSTQSLTHTVQALLTQDKGILAADESFPTIKKRFEKTGIQDSKPARREYREMLFTTPGIEKFISGVIMFDETIRQSSRDNVPFPKLLSDKRITPGIKVDQGKTPHPDSPREFITHGLEGLGERLEEYRSLGARFAKWRAVIVIGKDLPSTQAIQDNAKLLAQYTHTCQSHDIVPIVEPEVLMDGDHTINKCMEVTTRTLQIVFEALQEKKVSLEHILLKPNMIVPGRDNPQKISPAQAADTTLTVLHKTVPSSVPGIAFLSGGQTPKQATEILNKLLKRGPHPWILTFSFGRALQERALHIWQGHTQNISAAQTAFYKRAKLCSLAVKGEYDTMMENS
ncbi:MAG: class I fructose-bisphosphate aldolase [Candidatus Paceibacterota bacterium]